MSTRPTLSTEDLEGKQMRTIDWDLVNSIDVLKYRRNKDKSTSKKLIKSYLSADSLFSNREFCPPEFVLKHFYLMQVALEDMVQENKKLRQRLDKSQENMLEMSECIKSQKMIIKSKPEVVYTCHICSKCFYAKDGVIKHLKSKHFADQNAIDLRVRTIREETRNVPLNNTWQAAFEDELNSMYVKMDVERKKMLHMIRTEYKQKINQLQRRLKLLQVEKSQGSTNSSSYTNSSVSDYDEESGDLVSDTTYSLQNTKRSEDTLPSEHRSNSSDMSYVESESLRLIPPHSTR